MKSPKASLMTILGLLGTASFAEARISASKADSVVAASKRATGGAAWDAPQGCFEEGTRADGAITYQTKFSLTGYGMRIDSARSGNSRSMGFNGKARWQANDKGEVDILSDETSIQEGIVTAYLSNNGFYYPDRFPATLKYVREAKEAGRKFDILEITPKGARPLEMWFDRSTHLVRRVVDNQGRPPVKVEASDYRTIDGLTIASKLNVLGPDGVVIDQGIVTSFRCGPIDQTIFDPPMAR
jgi:hypothetical protein